MMLGYILLALIWLVHWVMAPGGNLGGDEPNYPQQAGRLTLPTRFGLSGNPNVTIDINGNVTIPNNSVYTGQFLSTDTNLIRGNNGFANNAGAQAATLTNGPTAGNPTKWIPINDNGTVRNIPAW